MKFLKAARDYDTINTKDIYKFLDETQKGAEMSIESYNKKIWNYNTKWFLYLESEEFKGWVRKEKDFQKLGFLLTI